ncbi:MAG: methyltransferase domain-containing protein [Candidatus Magasanikbacteria bacterium]
MYHSGNQLIDISVLFHKAHLQPGMHVADLGCGRTGHVVFPASRVVGDMGIIYAVDVLKDVLKNVMQRARDNGLVNIHTVWANAEQSGKVAIPSGSLDLVFISNVLFQAGNTHDMLEEASRLLKDKARLVIVDWNTSDLPFGPSREQLIDFADVEKWGKEHGFVLQEEFDAGKYHTGIVLYKHQ